MVPGAAAVPRPDRVPRQSSFGHAGQGIRSRQDRRRLLRLGRALGAGRRPWGYDKGLSLGGFKGWVDAGGEAEKG